MYRIINSFSSRYYFVYMAIGFFLLFGTPVDLAASEPGSGDKTKESGGILSLGECLQIALQNNPDLARKKWEVESADSDYQIARSKLRPQLKGQGGLLHTADPQAIIKARRLGDPVPYDDDIYSADLVLSYPIFTGGQLESRASSAKLQVDSQSRNLAFTAEELSYYVTRAYYSILGQQKVVESLEFSQKTLNEHLKRVTDLLLARKAAKVDKLRTEVRLADIEQRLIKERNNLTLLYFQLGNLLGDSSAIRAGQISGELEISGLPDDFAVAHQQAVSRRKDYQALQLKMEAQKRNVRAARGERMPEVSLKAAYGNRWPGEKSLSSQEVGEIYLMASFPVFDGGRIKAAVKRETSQQKALAESLRKLELAIRLEVETAIANLRSALARETVSQKAVEQANESLRIEREKYEYGKGAIIDVLDAQSALLDSQTAYYRSCADFNIALAAYRMATGVNQ